LGPINPVLHDAEGKSHGKAHIPGNRNVVSIRSSDPGPARGTGHVAVYISPISHVQPFVRTIESDGIGHGRVGKPHPLKPVVGPDLIEIVNTGDGGIDHKIVEHVLGIVGQLLGLQPGGSGDDSEQHDIPKPFHAI
jgi:hypothetical protein